MVTQQALQPSTRLTFDTVESDRKRLLKHVQLPAVKNVCLDLSQVEQCDSAGLALLIELKRLCMQFDKPFKIEGMPSAIHDLAEFCGVDMIL